MLVCFNPETICLECSVGDIVASNSRFCHWDIEKTGHLSCGALALALGQ